VVPFSRVAFEHRARGGRTVGHCAYHEWWTAVAGLSFLDRGVKGGSDVPPRLQKSVKAVCDWFVIGAYVPFLLIK